MSQKAFGVLEKTWRTGQGGAVVLNMANRGVGSKVTFRDPKAVEERARWFYGGRVFRKKVRQVQCPEAGAHQACKRDSREPV